MRLNIYALYNYIKIYFPLGVGCSKKHDDNWIAHQDDFNSLLASLNSQNTLDKPAPDSTATGSSDIVQVLSLEQKSKKSKRVQ